MVGDSLADIAAARAAGVPVVGVDYGYTETPVAELGPDRVISALSELPAAVVALLGAPDSQIRAGRR
jgi:phosphoglycolate phosphatase